MYCFCWQRFPCRGVAPVDIGATHCLTRNLTVRSSRNTLSADHWCVFNLPTTPPISPHQKRPEAAITLQLHLEKEELSLESSWESSLEPHPLRAFLASMCHARSCNPSDWYPSSKARTA